MMEMDEKPQFSSIKQLKLNLKETLKNSGVLDTVKAQIRQEFINNLTAPSKDKLHKPKLFDIRERMIFSLIFDLLRSRKLLNTISVFLAECGIDSTKSSLLSDSDMINLIKYNAISNSYKNINDPSHKEKLDLMISQELIAKKRTSILDVIIHFCLSNASDNSVSIETQTDMTGPGAMEVLNSELQDIRKLYANHYQAEQSNPSKTIEERMIAFQRDCEKRILKDVETQVHYFKENAIAKIKLEESKKYNIMIETMRKELENEYNIRIQSHIERENEMTRRMADRERELNQSQYDYRQMMQREIDELRSREESNKRKIELESQGIKILELRLKEAQNILESRERELNRKEQLFDEKSKDINIKSKKESYEQLQCERDQLSLEKMGFIIEKKKFDDERNNQMAIVESAHYAKEKLKNCLDQLNDKELEIDSLKRHIERVNVLKIEEDKQIEAMMRSIDPSMENISKSQQIIKLIQKTSDLENKLMLLSDSKQLVRSLSDKEEEVKHLKNQLDEEKSKNKQKLEQILKENVLMKSHLSSEKSKVSSTNMKLYEVEKISNEKDATIESLRKQINSYYKTSTDSLKTKQNNKKMESIDSDLYNSKLLKEIYNKLHDDQFLVQRMSYIDDNNNNNNNNKGFYTNQFLSSLETTANNYNNKTNNNNNFSSFQPNNILAINKNLLSNNEISNEKSRRQVFDNNNNNNNNNNDLNITRINSNYSVGNASLNNNNIQNTNNNSNNNNFIDQNVQIPVNPSEKSLQIQLTDEVVKESIIKSNRNSFSTEESDYSLRIEMEEKKKVRTEDVESQLNSTLLNRERKQLETEERLLVEKREEMERLQRQTEEEEKERLQLAKQQLENRMSLQQQQLEQEVLIRIEKENELKQKSEEEVRLKLEKEREEEEKLKRLKLEQEKREEEEENRQRIKRQQEEEEEEAKQVLKKQQQEEMERQLRKEKEEEEEEENRLRIETEKEESEEREREERQRQEELEKEMEEKKKSEEDALAIQEARARVLARRKQKQMRDSTESLSSMKSDPDSVKDNIEEETPPPPADNNNVYTASFFNKDISTNKSLTKSPLKKENTTFNENESSDEVQNFEAGNNTMDESDDQWK